MKVLAINGSPNRHGCTDKAMSYVIEELEKAGIEVDYVHIGAKAIQGCVACYKCQYEPIGQCYIKNDIINECIEKMKEADGLLIGCPVYFSGINGQMKSFMDRFIYANPYISNKVGAAVVSLRRTGGSDTFHQLNNYLQLRNMIIPNNRYMNIIHGMRPQDLEEDYEGVQIMKTLGINMAWLMKCVELGKKEYGVPKLDTRVRTHFVREYSVLPEKQYYLGEKEELAAQEGAKAEE